MNSELYYSRTGNSLRAAIAVELAGIKPHLHAVDLALDEHNTPEFLKLNPAGKIPVLVEYGDSQTPLVLTQSGAILEYLIERYRPDLLPNDPAEKALARTYSLAALSDIAIQNALARYLSSHPSAAEFVLQRTLHAIDATFESLQHQLFFGGTAANIADYANVPVIYMREALLRNTPNTSHILDWLGRMKDDAAVHRAIEYAGKQLSE